MSKRLYSDFTDNQGQAWTLEIHDADYTGAAAHFTSTRNGFQLEWSSPADETHPTLLPSSLRVEIVRTSAAVDSFLAAIPAREEGDVVAKLYKGTALEWLGLVLPESLEVEADDYNSLATFEAVDDLGMLSRQPYRQDNGESWTGWDRITDHLLKVLNKTRTAAHMTPTELGGADFLRVVDHLRPQDGDGTAPASFYTYRTRVQHEAFYQVEDGNTDHLTCADVLEQLAQLFGARVFFAAGAWNFAPPFAYTEDTTPSFYGFQQDGTAGTSSGSLPAPLDLTDISTTAAGWATIYHPPFRAVYREQRYGGNLPSVGPLTVSDSAGNWDTQLFSNLGHVYQTGTTFTVSGTLRIALNEDPTLTGSDRVVRWLLRVLVTATGEEVGGTRYYVAEPPAPSIPYDLQTVTWYDSSNNQTAPIFNPTATPDPGTWTATPGASTWACWTPPQVAADTPAGGSALVFPFTFTTTETVTTAANVGVTCSLEGWTGHYADGGNNTATASNSASYLAQAVFYKIEDLTVTLGDAGGDSGNAVRYGQLVNSATKLVENMELPPAVIGDRITDNTSGRLQVTEGASTPWKDTASWTSNLTPLAAPVHRVLCSDRIQLRGQVLHSFTGELHQRDYFTPLQAVTASGSTYLLTSVTRYLDTAITGLTATLLDPVEVTPTGTDDDGQVVPGPGWPGPLGGQDPETTDPNGTVALGVASVQQAQPGGSVLNLPSDAVDDSSSAQKFATASQLTQIATNETAISTVSGSLATTQAKLELIYKTFSPQGDDYTTTTVKYEADKTDGMKVELQQQASTWSSASGNTTVELTESSPGTYTLNLQDELDPAGTSVALYALGDSRGNRIGINTASPAANLDVVGTAKISDTLRVLGSIEDPTALNLSSNTSTPEEGGVQYDGDDGRFMLGTASGSYDPADDPWLVKNQTGATIARGVPVYVSGTLGASGRKLVAPMIADGSVAAHLFLGVTAAAIADGADGYVLHRGTVRGINTSTLSGVLYVSDSTAGTWTTTQPTAPSLALAAAFVVNSATNGTLAVRVQPDQNIGGGGGDLIDDTSPQLGGNLDGNGYNLDLSSNTSSALIITGNQYAFRYRSTAGVLQNTGLFFNVATGSYEFLNGAAACIFCIKAGSGELSIGDMAGGTNYVLPTARGAAGDILMTDGAGNLDFTAVTAGSNLAVTPDPSAGTLTVATIDSPTFTTVLVGVGGVASLGAGSFVAGLSTNGTLTAGTTSSFQGVATFSAGLLTEKIEFLGGGTSTIGPVQGLPTSPQDLELRSNGSITLVLDYDSDEPAQAFIVKNQAGTVIFQVDEDGITSGLLTVATPVLDVASSYQQGSSQTATVTNYTAGTTYTAAIYDAAGDEVTGSPVTQSGADLNFTTPSTTGTGYELRVRASRPGLLLSAEAVATFEVTPSRTFTHWRMQACNASGTPTTQKLGVLEMNYWTGTSGTGTKYPTTAATSNTSISGVTISAGHQYSSGYASWEAFDRAGANEGYNDGSGSMWWTLGVPSASANWNQLEFSSAQTFQSATVHVYRSFSDATHVKFLGSNTGNFSGEEVECAILALDGSATGAGATYTANF